MEKQLFLLGMGTPNSTITITSKTSNAGDIDHIDTIQIGTDGKWNYEHLFSPDLEVR